MKKILLVISLIAGATNFLFAQNFNMQLRSEILYPYTCASIWGYAKDEREYALVGTTNGVSIVDVTNPDSPNSLFDVTHNQSEWREIKTYSHYAYATNESGGGVLIIDLANLPASYTQSSFIYDPAGSGKQTTGHTLWIDEKGRLFVFGGDLDQGYTCFDLTVDPLNPPFLGGYQNHYIHDGFVRGDTLWASEIFNGQEEVLNVENPAAPISMATFSTPSAFTHNAWPTHDNHYLFTTDEVDDSYLTSYDVSNLDNITELDRAQSNPGSNVIIHNVHLLNDQFAIVAYYKDGVVVFDVSHPDNMIEVGSYDTDPQESGGNYGGTWGVYPYLPSGNIIASDYADADNNFNGKLTVITPTYVSASWLEGLVTDSITGAPINNVSVQIISTPNSDATDLTGNYKTGCGMAGTFSVQFFKAGYATKTIPVNFVSGVVTTLNVKLFKLTPFTFTGQVFDAVTSAPLANASVFLDGGMNGSFNATTDANGNFSVTSIYAGTYNAYAGVWGHVTAGTLNISINELSSPLTFYLDRGYYDDFIFNFGWLPQGGNSGSGKWVRGEPIGTVDYYNQYVNPELDVTDDFGDQCFMTGNGGGSPGTSDVDATVVNLTSPVFDLSNYSKPYIKFYAWWYDGISFGNADDSMHISISNSTSTATLINLMPDDAISEWIHHVFKVSDYLTPSSNMTIKLSLADVGGNQNWIEGGIDKFEVTDSLATSTAIIEPSSNLLSLFPNPFNGSTQVAYQTEFNNDNLKLIVTDILGKEMESHRVANNSGVVTVGSNLSSGVYLVSLMSGNEVMDVKKIVKE